MGFISSLFRLIKSMFGLAEGKTDRVTDQMLTASADTIRSQYRKTQLDLKKDYEEMESAVGDLKVILNDKKESFTKLDRDYQKTIQAMNGAITEFKRNQDEKFKAAYIKFGTKKKSLEEEISQLKQEILDQENVIDNYCIKLSELNTTIENLKQEEAKTIADITSSRKIQSINNKINNISTDTQTRNLEAIREQAKKARAITAISSKVSGEQELEEEKLLLNSAFDSNLLDEFNKATALDAIFVDDKPQQQIAKKTSLDNIFDD